jgi:hypothetical protein
MAAAASGVDDSSLQLPSYLLRLVGQNDYVVKLTNVFYAAAELSHGGDSDAEGDNTCGHDVALTASLLERISLLKEKDAVEDVIDNSVVLACAGML